MTMTMTSDNDNGNDDEEENRNFFPSNGIYSNSINPKVHILEQI